MLREVRLSAISYPHEIQFFIVFLIADPWSLKAKRHPKTSPGEGQ